MPTTLFCFDLYRLTTGPITTSRGHPIQRGLAKGVVQFRVFTHSRTLGRRTLSQVFPNLFQYRFSFNGFALSSNVVYHGLHRNVQGSVYPTVSSVTSMVPAFRGGGDFRYHSTTRSNLFKMIFRPSVGQLSGVIPIVRRLHLQFFLFV